VETWKRVIISAAVLLGALALVGSGTMATFTAQVGNPDNTFATGTLVLSDTKLGGIACLSTGGGSTDTNVNNNCDTLYDLSVRAPGDSATADLTIKDEGSLAISIMRVFAPSCTDANAVGETFHGSGSPCGAVQLYIQEFSDPGFSVPSVCLYGGAVGNTCNFSDLTKTLSNFTTNFNSTINGLSAGGIAAGGSDYLEIGVKLPSSAGNPLQGRQATIAFDWFATQ
jgi:predicted ribosomally synthesized peptide with SipW-like signal peptide